MVQATLFTNSVFKRCKRPGEASKQFPCRHVPDSSWCQCVIQPFKRSSEQQGGKKSLKTQLFAIDKLSVKRKIYLNWDRTTLLVIIMAKRDLGKMYQAGLLFSLPCFLRASAIKLKGEEQKQYPLTWLMPPNNRASLMSSGRVLCWPKVSSSTNSFLVSIQADNESLSISRGPSQPLHTFWSFL